ncbi:MAG: replicative DNA helicase [Acidobacteria bacterium]|nr:replicative DNA helicase [Acidobacteriota bacterium]
MSAEESPIPGPRTSGARDEPSSWDENAERAVLGAILLDSSSFDPASEILTSSDFYRANHRVIFDAITRLSARHSAIDVFTLRAELERANDLERAGGIAFLMSLIDGMPRTTNVRAYAQIVHDRSLRRQLSAVADTIRATAADGSREAIQLIEEAERSIFTLSEQGRIGGFRSVQEVGPESLAVLEELSETRNLVTGLATGYVKLDRMTSGLQRGDLIILAARPSMGKTALALNMAQYAAVSGRASIGIFSLEMSAQQLFFRLIAGEGRIDSHKLRTGRLTPEEWDRVIHAYETLTQCHIYIDDTSGVTPMEIRSKARRLQAEHDLDLIVVDYLQLMRLERRTDSRQQEISEISRSLKGIAKELKVPVLALSQLSRAPDQRQGDHRPQLSDLRESGAIEQDADVVMFIFREEVYEKDKDKVLEKELEGKAEVIVAKQRNGPTGFVPLYFVKQFTRFENQDEAFGD